MNKKLVIRLMMGIFVVLALSVCREASAQRFRGGGGRGIGMRQPHPVSPMQSIQHSGVRRELGLNKATSGKVNSLLTEYRKHHGSTSDKALRKKLDAEYGRKLNALLDKAQRTRLREIAIQDADVGALQDPTVIEELDLTPDQQDQIGGIIETLAALDPAIVDSARKVVGSAGKVVDSAGKVVDSAITSILSAGNPGDGAHAAGGPAADLKQRREQLFEKAAGVLTKHQQEKFEKMKGKPFTFTPEDWGRGDAQ